MKHKHTNTQLQKFKQNEEEKNSLKKSKFKLNMLEVRKVQQTIKLYQKHTNEAQILLYNKNKSM